MSEDMLPNEDAIPEDRIEKFTTPINRHDVVIAPAHATAGNPEDIDTDD